MDIRLDVEFFNHPKVIKLERRLALPGVKALLVLWTWAARLRPDGVLVGMDDDDIEIAAGWTGEPGVLVKVLRELRWLDLNSEIGVYELHEWSVHQPWASESENRSNIARLTRLASVSPGAYAVLMSWGYKRLGLSVEQYQKVRRLSDGVTGGELRVVLAEFAPQDDATLTHVDAALTPIPAPVALPLPIPEPDRNIERIPSRKVRDLSPMSTVSTVENSSPWKKELGRPIDDQIVRAFRELLPGHDGRSFDDDRAWLEKQRQDFPDMDIRERLQELFRWWCDRNKPSIKSSRAYFRNWLKKSRALQS